MSGMKALCISPAALKCGWFCSMVHILKSAVVVQAAYNAIPYALSPVLGNPLALAAVNVDRKADPFTQVSIASFGLSLSWHVLLVYCLCM